MSDINLSIEDEVRAAMAEHQEEVPAAETPPVAEPEHDDHVVIETPPDGERDERGRFKAKEKAEEGDPVEAAASGNTAGRRPVCPALRQGAQVSPREMGRD
jgi:hypothetical protein